MSKISTKVNISSSLPTRKHIAIAKQKRRLRKQKHHRISFVFVSLIYILGFVALMGGFNYLSALNNNLPEVDTTFSAYGLASTITDRKGVELYTVAGDFMREPLDITQVPPHVVWSFIAAEDLKYFEHDGIEPMAMARCAALMINGDTDSVCGGSTITQQLVKMTVVGNELSVERKLKEILMASKLEDNYGKQKILEHYLSVVPMGSNIYGITVGAQFYFGKTPKELSLAESTLLASIIQNPVHMSPTLGYPDIETARARVVERQEYVLNQMEKNMEYINDMVREIADDVELGDTLTPESIAEARVAKLSYKDPIFTNKKAGHFVDYVQYLLTTRPYNNGKPFTSEELAFGGYKIETTLDYKLQKHAERTVAQAVRISGKIYGANNAAMMTLQPQTGEILVMVGSKSYYQKSSGCNQKGVNCTFNPQVNNMTSLHSPGSSTKPFGYYEAYRQGSLYTGSLLPDVPVNVGGGYNLKNWNGTFFGVSPKTSAGQMLCESRNLPAVVVYELIGRKGFLSTMQKFGYTTYNNPKDYGHSVILGGADIKGVEHAQAYAVFANNGMFVQNEAVKRITDSEGNVIYEHKPEPQRVGDARAAYMTNYSLRNCFQASWDGRQVAAKTGTSQDNMDAWTVMYSRDFVTVGWMGNNNNKDMKRNAFGVTAVMPWLKRYMKEVGNTQYFKAKRGFVKPSGVVYVSPSNGRGFVGGIKYKDRALRVEVTGRTALVCKDQPTRLARNVDIQAGKAVNKYFRYYKMPVPAWQGFLNSYLGRRGIPNGGPTSYCTINRKTAAPPPTTPPSTGV